jgi:biopolymer transport protein ExbB
METSFGLLHLFSHTDAVGKTLALVLIAMSIWTWYLIVVKASTQWRMRRHARHFLRFFWEAPDLQSVNAHLRADGVKDPFAHLAHHGFRAIEQHGGKGGKRLIDAGSAEEFLTRALRRAIEQDTARLESGLTVLASIGSSAPFVGLFGTVWGIYHALIAIGASGQASLDKVAGPVGEALVMTAFGLAVAIPAVLAHNFFARANRVVLAELDGFAHDFFAFLSTGTRIGAPARTGKVAVLAPKEA